MTVNRASVQRGPNALRKVEHPSGVYLEPRGHNDGFGPSQPMLPSCSLAEPPSSTSPGDGNCFRALTVRIGVWTRAKSSFAPSRRRIPSSPVESSRCCGPTTEVSFAIA
jgi:hypothetical protein